jgi:formylglycine-generating enzyme
MTVFAESTMAVEGQTEVSSVVHIPAGEFLMGCAYGGEFEKPIHSVYIDEFWIGRAPVTNAEYASFVQATGYVTDAERAGTAWGYDSDKYRMIEGLNWRSYSTRERQDHPVVLVSWNDAHAYCDWNRCRLPSEAEWEKAARGRLISEPYPWGHEAPDGSQSNFAKSPSRLPPTTSVGTFPPNQYGLVDVVGNVWQWCEDWYGPDYYRTSPLKNPVGPAKMDYRVRRGGSWNVVQAFRLRCSNRGAMDSRAAAPNVGFRCAWSQCSSRM